VIGAKLPLAYFDEVFKIVALATKVVQGWHRRVLSAVMWPAPA
jgi:hypothetical protein